MPNGDTPEVIIADTTECLGFPNQVYLLQAGGTAKGFGRYGSPIDAIKDAERRRRENPNIFIRVTGEKDKKIYYQLPGEFI